jgi:hypothetical protein
MSYVDIFMHARAPVYVYMHTRVCVSVFFCKCTTLRGINSRHENADRFHYIHKFRHFNTL